VDPPLSATNITTTSHTHVPEPATTSTPPTVDGPQEPIDAVASTAESEAEENEADFLQHTHLPRTDPLAGLKVVIIHVKDLLTDEKPPVEETILSELNAFAAREEVQLRCEFVVAGPGMSFLF